MNTGLSAEWTLLQAQYDDYEKAALLIKVFTVSIVLVALITGLSSLLCVLFILILWLQEGVIRTVQSRTEQRLCTVEKAIANSPATSTIAMQLHTDFGHQRATPIRLVVEYIRHALRPTVAMIYIGLVIIQGVSAVLV
jgi:hypothetical protein